jgi:hypothetical protein
LLDARVGGNFSRGRCWVDLRDCREYASSLLPNRPLTLELLPSSRLPRPRNRVLISYFTPHAMKAWYTL